MFTVWNHALTLPTTLDINSKPFDCCTNTKGKYEKQGMHQVSIFLSIFLSMYTHIYIYDVYSI